MKLWLMLFVSVFAFAACNVDDDRDDGRAPALSVSPDECGENLPACPLDVPCVDGRCASDAALCSREGHCGALFNCRDGACVVDEQACRSADTECCSDADCDNGDACVGFTCGPRSCWRDRDCVVFYGLGPTCSSTANCGAGEACVQFWPERCVDPEACCDGCAESLVSDVHGNGVLACTYQGRCDEEGFCVWSSPPPPGGEFQ